MTTLPFTFDATLYPVINDGYPHNNFDSLHTPTTPTTPIKFWDDDDEIITGTTPITPPDNQNLNPIVTYDDLKKAISNLCLAISAHPSNANVAPAKKMFLINGRMIFVTVHCEQKEFKEIIGRFVAKYNCSNLVKLIESPIIVKELQFFTDELLDKLESWSKPIFGLPSIYSNRVINSLTECLETIKKLNALSKSAISKSKSVETKQSEFKKAYSYWMQECQTLKQQNQIEIELLNEELNALTTNRKELDSQMSEIKSETTKEISSLQSQIES